MNQSYLDIARRYIDTHPAPAEVLPPQDQQRLPGDVDLPAAEPLRQLETPVSLDAYRTRTSRRCSECGHGLSIIALADLCGRCAARPYQPVTTAARSNHSQTDVLRGEVLAAVDRQRYPRVHVLGRLVGGGTDEWLPLLREANDAQLREILHAIARRPVAAPKEVDDEHPALID
jgi:hypothetical protein